ncbi:MAG: hypothetical protein KGL48_03285 [Sphingomonadales bacterium]|nr:hypothetical protein [Sphingomonadales bacterium]
MVAIADNAAVSGAWFGDDVDAAQSWAETANARGYNLYWTANVSKPLSTKPTKADILSARLVHVDVDPPRGGAAWDKAEVLARIRALNPTTVIDSGNGLQALWRLTEPTTVDRRAKGTPLAG